MVSKNIFVFVILYLEQNIENFIKMIKQDILVFLKELSKNNTKEWFDKTNANSYFSGTITLDDKESFFIPFKYGYGSQYEFEAKAI
jgi:hypothetical protein